MSNKIADMLVPYKKHLQINQIKSDAIEAVNRSMVIIVVWFSLSIISKLILNYYISHVISIFVLVLLLLYVLNISLISSVNSPENNEVAKVVDCHSNEHDVVLSGLEYQEQERLTTFAEITSNKAREVLRGFEATQIPSDCGSIKYTLLFISILLFVVDINFDYLPISEISSETQTIVALNENYISPVDIKKGAVSHRKTNKGKHSNYAGIAKAAYTDSLNDSLNSGLGGRLQATVDGSTGKGGRLNSENVTRDRKNDADIFRLENKKLTSASFSNLAETQMKSTAINVANGKQTQQESVKSSDKPQKPTNNSNGRHPFLDDTNASPGRELGRAGKKGKPGNGRGGLGAVKKSRASASIMTGQTIPVFIKSRQSKGRSKSFMLNAPLDDAKKREMVLPQQAENESFVDKHYIDADIKHLVSKYFKELNNYANRKHTGSSK